MAALTTRPEAGLALREGDAASSAPPAKRARAGATGAPRGFDGRGRPRVALMLSHSTPGGIYELWRDIAEGLDGRGFSVDVVALYPPGAEAGEGAREAAAGRHVSEASPGSPGGMARLMTRLVALLRAERFDAVVTAMPAANVLLPLAVRAAGVRTRVVISHHTPIETYRRALVAADRWTGCLDAVRAVVSVSDTVAASLDGFPPAYRAKRRTIHNALPPRVEAQIAALRAARDAGSGSEREAERGAAPPLVVATGRLAAQKNYPVLLRAMARLPHVRAEILGTGADEVELRALALRLGVAERVDFLGNVPRAEALRRLAGATAFAQPSLFEGHSLGLLEAASMHLPLVVSTVPVQIESVTAPDGRRCGAAVDPQDDAALAAALAAVIDDPARRRSARADAAHLAASRTFGGMLAAYEDLLRV